MSDSEGYYLEDPWNWTIDQVVTALCDHGAAYRIACKSEDGLPNGVWLEQRIREHCVSGRCLLTAIDYVTLREEFGIPALGPRTIIVHEIRRLKNGSRQWLDWKIAQDTCNSRRSARLQMPASRPQANPTVPQTPTTQPTPEATNDLGTTRESSPVTPYQQFPAGQHSSIQQSQQWLNELPNSPQLQVLEDAPTFPSGEDRIPDSTQVPAIEDASTFPSGKDRIPDSTQMPIIENPPTFPSGEDRILGPQNETYVVDDTGNKRRRLCLGVSASVDVPEESSLTTGNVVSNKEEGQHELALAKVSSSPVIVAPQEDRETTGPILASQHYENHGISIESSVHTGELSEITRSRAINLIPPSNTGYLGTKPLPVDAIFYELDSESQNQLCDGILEDDKEGLDCFAFSGNAAATGERQYVAARMKYFLQQKSNLYQRGSKLRYGICPYPDYFGQARQQPSITIFEPVPGTSGLQALRKDRALWKPPNLPSHRHVPDRIILNTVALRHQDDGENWDFLEKMELHARRPLTTCLR
ncbi:MAG: hypothetical protein Q9218_003591 [Villophora microphyllina]